MTPPRLLFLCHTLPYPPDGGVWIRTYHVLRLLSSSFEVTALCFHRSRGEKRGHDVEESVEKLGELADVEAFPVPQDEARSRFLWDHLRSVLAGRVFTVYKHRSREFRSRLMHHLESGAFDVVHLDSLDLSEYLPLLGALPVVCVHHNVESRLLRRRAETETSPWKRWYVSHQARLQRREEERWCRQVQLNVTVSPKDRDLLKRVVPEAPVVVVPNGVDTDYFRPAGGDGRGLVFVGSSNWFPNRDALEYFCDSILPHLRDEPKVRPIRWIGSTSDSDRARYHRENGVELTGYVEDIRSLVREAACYVVPLRVGGGSRLKILDAWAMGKAIVSTPVGCEGLEALDGTNILIRDTPEAFAEGVATVLQDAELRNRLEVNGRETAVSVYSWEVIGQDMNRAYRDLV